LKLQNTGSTNEQRIGLRARQTHRQTNIDRRRFVRALSARRRAVTSHVRY